MAGGARSGMHRVCWNSVVPSACCLRTTYPWGGMAWGAAGNGSSVGSAHRSYTPARSCALKKRVLTCGC